MLPRYRCSLLAEKPTGVFGLPALRSRFPRRPRVRTEPPRDCRRLQLL